MGIEIGERGRGPGASGGQGRRACAAVDTLAYGWTPPRRPGHSWAVGQQDARSDGGLEGSGPSREAAGAHRARKGQCVDPTGVGTPPTRGQGRAVPPAVSPTPTPGTHLPRTFYLLAYTCARVVREACLSHSGVTRRKLVCMGQHGCARVDTHGVRHGGAPHGGVRRGKARWGKARHGRYGTAGLAERGGARPGAARPGLARLGRQGAARFGGA